MLHFVVTFHSLLMNFWKWSNYTPLDIFRSSICPKTPKPVLKRVFRDSGARVWRLVRKTVLPGPNILDSWLVRCKIRVCGVLIYDKDTGFHSKVTGFEKVFQGFQNSQGNMGFLSLQHDRFISLKCILRMIKTFYLQV